MRMVSRFMAVAVLSSLLTACVSRVGTGPAPTPSVEQPPPSGPVAAECGTADVTVTGALTEKPRVTLPTGCAPPSSLLALDLEVGRGPAAVAGSNVDVGYVMIAWSDGSVLDSTWSGNDNQPLPVKNLGHADVINGWNLGLPGIREGGRRLIGRASCRERVCNDV